MIIKHIKIENFIGAKHIDETLDTPITLIAGHNASGKSSVFESISMALIGESQRVKHKKDYDKLITSGSGSGYVQVDMGDDVFSIILPSGKASRSSGKSGLTDLPALPYILDAQRFASLPANERRTFLFGLMGLKTDFTGIKQRLLDSGCEPGKIDTIAPYLRAGFDAAHKEAQGRAREAKASWKTVTGGETWGKDKAARWQPERLPADVERAVELQNNAEKKAMEADARLGDLQRQHGAATVEAERYRRAQAQRAGLEQRAGSLPRIKEKLARDEAELKEWKQKVAALNDSAQSQNSQPCPECGVVLMLKDGRLTRAAPIENGTDGDIARLPEYENALRLMKSAVANDDRDIRDAESAIAALDELKNLSAPSTDTDLDALSAEIAALKKQRDEWLTDFKKYSDMVKQALQRQDIIIYATNIHRDVVDWTDIADRLAPDGIPDEILGEALEPINDRLDETASLFGWMQPHIGDDMEIEVAYPGPGNLPHPYALLSESEKWRVDAMIAESISKISGLKLLILDRIDVLDLVGRAELIKTLDTLARQGNIETALLFCTLKQFPSSGLPETVRAVWLENGAVKN